MDDPTAAPAAAALLAEVVTARQSAQALRHALDRLLAQGGAAVQAGLRLFEAVWHTLPPFEDEGIAEAAAALYGSAGEPGCALLMSGLAAQLSGQTGAPLPAGTPPALAAQARAIIGSGQAGAAMLHALELRDPAQDWAGSAALFELVWPRVPAMVEYWVYYRMAQVFTALGRRRESAAIAGIAIQIEPAAATTDQPYRRVLDWLRGCGHQPEAAMLCRRRAALCPEPQLLLPDEFAALIGAAGELPEPPPPEGRVTTLLHEASVRPAAAWRSYGGEAESLRRLRSPMAREPIYINAVHDAEVLLDRGAVAVFLADGRPQIDLSLRDYPGLVRRSLAAARDAGRPVEEIAIDEAVLIADEFPGPNLCHFMLDQASRMALYREAGVDLGNVTAIGPELRTAYQRIAGAAMGIQSYIASTRQARLRVGRLWVSSNCRNLHHPAHWGSAWALDAMRRGFDLAPRTPRRRLLISRADSTYRRIANHAEVADLLHAFGFETIVPGQMDFPSQIAAFRDATHIVGPHGAGMANILFCSPGTHVLEVFHPLYGTWAYAMISPPLGLDYAAMVARDGESDDPVYNDPTLPQERRNQHSGRDMRIDLDQLVTWLLDTGA